MPLLPPGAYTVTVKAAGFAVNTLRSIQATVSETTTRNVALTVGAVGEDVQVYGDPTALNAVASPTFGKITGTLTNPRIIQFAAKFVF